MKQVFITIFAVICMMPMSVFANSMDAYEKKVTCASFPGSWTGTWYVESEPRKVTAISRGTDSVRMLILGVGMNGRDALLLEGSCTGERLTLKHDAEGINMTGWVRNNRIAIDGKSRSGTTLEGKFDRSS